MSSALGAIGLFLGIATLIFLGWKGVHTIVSAIAAALVVIIFNWMNFWDTFNNSFLFGASGFVQQYFLLFILGALLMSDTLRGNFVANGQTVLYFLIIG